MRPHNHKHIWKRLDEQPQERPRPLAPSLAQFHSTHPLEIDRCECTSYGIETRCVDQDVEVVGIIAGLDTGGCNSLNGVGFHVDKRDIGLVEGLEVPGFKGDTFCAEAMAF